MWSETLLLKPKIDSSTGAAMERNLSARFARVAKRFGGGLKAIVKGSILGISLGLLNKLLNPLEDLQTKIKELLGAGTDIRDAADRFNTTPGQFKRVQDVAQSIGLSPDALRDLMNKFAMAVETARKEFATPGLKEISGSSLAVKNFVGDKDLAEGFFSFIQSLKQATPKIREGAEAQVFGEKQFGAARRFIEADFGKAFGTIGEPGTNLLNVAVNKLAALADQQRALQVQRETQDFLNAAGRINGKMIRDIEKAEKLKADRETKQLQSFDDLKKASIAIEEVKGGMETLLIQLNKGIGYLADIASFVNKSKTARWFRGVFGGNE